MKTNDLPEGLWSSSPTRRLQAASALTPQQLSQIHKSMLVDAPNGKWPHGQSTSVNPLVVVLGPSPGASPQAGDEADPYDKPQILPTVGPHPVLSAYDDGRRFFESCRTLFATILSNQHSDRQNSLALGGIMNLNPYREGNSINVKFDPSFARWVLKLISDHLKPRFLICLGLKGRIRGDAKHIFEDAFSGLNFQNARSVTFDAYEEKRLTFNEMEIPNRGENPMLMVSWPNHSSRVPFTNSDLWLKSCEEVRDRHRHLIT